MLDLDDHIYIGMLCILNVFAMLANLFLIWIIKHRTPKNLSAYAFLLRNIACVDFFSAFCSFMTVSRLQVVGGSMVTVHIGPCTLLSAQFCHIFFVGQVECAGYSVHLLLISFICRLWMANIKTGTDLPMIQGRLWIMTGVVAAYYAVSMLLCFLSVSYETSSLIGNATISTLNFSGGIADHVLPRFSAFSVMISVSIGFAAIFVIRRKLFGRLQTLTGARLHSHQQIYRSLTAQMLLPLGYIVAVVLWLLDTFDIVHSRSLQRAVYVSTSIFPLFSPLINMYFIPPYRKYLNNLFSASSRVEPTEAHDELSADQRGF